ncbi:MAG TPA: transcriptional repressor LexA [Firmicutes bacterium]|nr:transcriptional repressor LexA [Bacillota bacterium]
MKQLSPMRQKILDYISAYTDDNGYPPSVREICQAVGLRSPSTVHSHLKILQDAGLLEKGEGKTRSITLKNHSSGVKKIPILGVVTAGLPILMQEDILGYIPFEYHAGEYFALRVRGDSMIGAGILEGDAVIVRRQETADNHAIVVAMLEDEATVKRLLLKKGQVWLMPENPAYDPIDGSQASILGLVVAVYREYRA